MVATAPISGENMTTSALISQREGDEESSPLLPKPSAITTPLPKLQLTILILLRMAEALTFHSI
jgi:hypothetical protein